MAQAKIDETIARINQLKAKAKLEVADQKISAYEQIEKLEATLETAKARLAEIKGSAEGAWEAMTDRFEGLYDDMSASLKNFLNKG